MAVTALLDDRQSCTSLRPTLKMIRDNVQLEARLIDDLLDLSRIARGQMEYRFEIGRCPCPDRADHRDLPGPDPGQGPPPGRSSWRPSSTTCAATRPACSRCSGTCSSTPREYTPEGGRIAIRTLSYGPGRLAIEVADDWHRHRARPPPPPVRCLRAGLRGGSLPCGRIGVGPDDQPVDRGGPRRDVAGCQRRQELRGDVPAGTGDDHRPGGLRGAVRRTAEPGGAKLAGAARRG